MTPSGPAVEGVSVIRRQHQAEPWYFSQKIVMGQALPTGKQGWYGVVFALSREAD